VQLFWGNSQKLCMLRPAPMSPIFITTGKTAIPGIELKEGIVLLRHGSIDEAEITSAVIKHFVEANQEPRLINVNIWWRKGLNIGLTR